MLKFSIFLRVAREIPGIVGRSLEKGYECYVRLDRLCMTSILLSSLGGLFLIKKEFRGENDSYSPYQGTYNPTYDYP